ncbi:MAG: DciA family protein [Gaiellaceae bacterium]
MERIGESVGRELARSGGDAGAALAEIVGVWPAAVGETVSRQAWPLRMSRDGTLHVATSSATWAFELDRLAADVRERLMTLLGPSAPPKLRFRVGPIPEPAPLPASSTGPPPGLPETSPETETEVAAIASEVDDPELRELVARAARASLSRARSGRHF